MGAAVGRRQSRAATDLAVRALAYPPQPAPIPRLPRRPRIRSARRAAAPSRTRDRAAARERPVAGGRAPPGPAPVRRRRADEGSLPRRARDGALDALARDTRHAVRRLARDWRFTIAAVLILGLAIGANTAIFSVVNAVLFRKERSPLPIAWSTSIRTIARAGRSSSPRTPPTRRWRSTPTSSRPRWPPAFRTRRATSTTAPSAMRSSSSRRRRISTSWDSGHRSAAGSTETEERPGAPLVAVSGIRRGPECSAQIRPSSVASSGSKVYR